MTPVSPLRLMLWLKWTLLWRGYRRNALKVISAIFSLVIFVPLSLGAAWAVWTLAQGQSDLAPIVARDTLALLYLLWIITPLLGFQLNESYDLTKLFAYPVSYQRIFAGSVLGSLLDLPVLLSLPTFAVLVRLFSPTLPAALLNVVILLLFLGHTLALGQAITLALTGFLRSRRFRDITIVVFPLIGMSYYIGQRLFFQQMGFVSPAHLLEAPVWRVAEWLPPGWAASGLAASGMGLLPALIPVLLLAAVTYLTLWVAATTMEKLYLGDAGPNFPQARTKIASRSRIPGTPQAKNALLARLPADIAAVAGKEWTYFRREPQYKAMLVQIVYTIVAIAIPVLLPMTSGRMFAGGAFWQSDWVLFGVSGTLLLSTLPLLFNMWGGEGAAITFLFSLPTSRRSMLLGKNLAHGAVALLINGAGLLAAAVVTGRAGGLPLALAWVCLALPVLLAAGNLVSIQFPHRMLVRGQRWSKGSVSASSDGAGCAYGVLYLLAYGVTFLALLPALAAVLLPTLLGASPFWYALSLPLAFAYALTLYVLLLGQAQTWLLSREPEIVAKIVPAD
ncbi:MAG: hypothetical protein M3Y13_06345 [Armatimonadota bacterium]|nr:hypothetical protein [Armatimonadota bacterium]